MKKILLIALTSFSLTLHAQGQKDQVKNYGLMDLNVGYLFSTNTKNVETGRPLFAGNGINANVNYRYGRTFGIVTSLSFSLGSINEKNAQNYGSSLVSSPFTAVTTIGKKNWNQTGIMAGPSFIFGKRYMEINAKFGVGFNNSNEISIDKYDGQTKVGSIFYAQQKSIIPVWEIGANILGTRIGKNSFWTFKTSYGSNGVSVGVNITAITSSCCCAACLGMCQRIGLCGGMQSSSSSSSK
jgi:hypothetical protein